MSTPSDAEAGTSAASARLQRVPSPVASPGHCALCGKFEHSDGFLWPQLDYEFYGTVYFCSDCVGEMARTFGYISPKDLSTLREHIDAQNAELNTLRQAVLGLESTVDGLIADAHRRNSSNHDSVVAINPMPDSVPGNPVDQPNEEPASQDSGVAVSAPESDERGPDEQDSVSRRNDLLDTSDADELLGL